MRINNDGYVLPVAIDRAIWIALRPRSDRLVSIDSIEFSDHVQFSLSHLEKKKGWGEYPKGVSWALLEAGYDLSGWQGVIGGDIPLGAGLSSSAVVRLRWLTVVR